MDIFNPLMADLRRVMFRSGPYDNNYGSLKEEDFTKCIQYLQKHPPMMDRDEKNDRLSATFQTTGDKHMKDGSYDKAIDSYTRGLQFAHSRSVTAAICFAKRSAPLQKLKIYEDSLLDVDRALQYPLPENLKIEVTHRKEQLARDLQKKQSSKAQKQQQNQPTKTNNCEVEPTLLHGESEQVPGASKAIAIAYNEKYGRHFVATKPIKAGDVLLIQPPYIVAPNELSVTFKPCHHCLKLTAAPLPCERCSQVLYCCDECQSEAYKQYHKIECGITLYESEIPIVRMLMIVTDQGASYDEIKNYAKELSKNEDPKRAGFTGDQFIGSSARAAISLCHRTNELYVTIYQVTLLATILKNNTDYLRDNDDVVGLAKLLYHLAHILTINMIRLGSKGLACVYAAGLYPVFSLLNHSCVSNVISYNLRDNRRVLRACRDIKPGEQIFANYLSMTILKHQNASSRKQELMGKKCFVCHCEACDRNLIFDSKLKGKLKMPARLQQRLRKCPTDIQCMWELLDLLRRIFREPCLEIELLKFALAEAYMNKESDHLRRLYTNLGVF